MVDVVGDMAVNSGTSSSNNIALGDNVVGASGAESNRAGNGAVVNVANAKSLVVDAHELTGSWARNFSTSASTRSSVGRASVAASRRQRGSARSCGHSGDRGVH